MHYTEYDTRLGAYAVIVEERDGVEQVLLALWNEAAVKKWTLPGGGVEMHETVQEGAVREVREETGYDIELGPILGTHSHVMSAAERRHRNGKAMKAFRVFFEARIVGGELTHEADGTTDEARWFPVAEVPTLLHVPIVEVGLGLAGRWPGAVRRNDQAGTWSGERSGGS